MVKFKYMDVLFFSGHYYERKAGFRRLPFYWKGSYSS